MRTNNDNIAGTPTEESTQRTIVLESWDLLTARDVIIRKCIEEANSNGGLSQKDIADQLGITGSFVSNYIKKNGISWVKPKPDNIKNAIALLKSKNFKIVELPEGATGLFVENNV